jgi:DNA polymerase III delta prime subunit|uniref:ATPase AAA-type core domain-containing protein n=1 Tax=viral metagenome TaxID=1070528 RepID=A0A6C0JDF7_9ZZZZ|tara:strand:+ start:326 stop:1300 length:975 start_codon:yes stop_codon:yes gene_type:complete
MNYKNELISTKYKPSAISDFVFPIEFHNLLRALMDCGQLNLLLLGSCCSGKTSIIDLFITHYYKGYSTRERNENILYISQLKDIGVQYFRNDLKIFCQSYSGIKNKKKIVVIDDIDGISEQTQQILRNCIDNYKSNVGFLCSCTTMSKVIENIQSRLLILKLPNLNTSRLLTVANKIIDNEQLSITTEAITALVELSNNSMRLLISYLELIYLLDIPVTKTNIYDMCTCISFKSFDTYLSELSDGNIVNAIGLVKELIGNGFNCMDVYTNLFTYIKIKYKTRIELQYKLIRIICSYISVFHELHEDDIELAFLSRDLSKVLHAS